MTHLVQTELFEAVLESADSWKHSPIEDIVARIWTVEGQVFYERGWPCQSRSNAGAPTLQILFGRGGYPCEHTIGRRPKNGFESAALSLMRSTIIS